MSQQLRGKGITLDKVLAPTDVTLRKAKIVCTMGPSCWEVPKLLELIDAGMNVARLNFSHGDHAVRVMGGRAHLRVAGGGVCFPRASRVRRAISPS